MDKLSIDEIKSVISSFENLEEELNELRTRIDIVRVTEEKAICRNVLTGDDIWCLENALNMLKAFKVNRLIEWLAETVS